MENKELINKIVEEFEGFKELQDFNLMRLEQYFEVIKYRNIIRKSVIEKLLDEVLSMIQTDKTKDLYTRVCLYYHAIDKQDAMEYAQFYLEMYNDDSIIKKIREEEIKVKKRKKKWKGKINEKVL